MIKKILGVILILVGVLGGLYVGGWVMFIQPILEACKAFDAGTLTGAIVGMTVLKCAFASLISGIIGYVGIFGGMILFSLDD